MNAFFTSKSQRQKDNSDDNSPHKGNGFVVDEKKPSPRAIIYKSELDYISRCILDYKNIETGGELFGFWTSFGTPVIMYAIGPGRNATHNVVYFSQDEEYFRRIGNILVNKYGLQHIGEWHSHHQLGLAKPSGQDASNVYQTIERFKLRRFLLCIGNCDWEKSTLNAFSFHELAMGSYIQSAWKIYDMPSPFRSIIDEECSDELEHPICHEAKHGKLYLSHEANNWITPSYDGDYWLNYKQNNAILKQIVDYLASQPDSHVSVQLDQENMVHIFVSKPAQDEHIVFGKKFPYEAPLIEVTKYGTTHNDTVLSENELEEDLKENLKENPVEVPIGEVENEAENENHNDQGHSQGFQINKESSWLYTGDIYQSFVSYYSFYFNY